jgi:hypothetical protein
MPSLVLLSKQRISNFEVSLDSSGPGIFYLDPRNTLPKLRLSMFAGPMILTKMSADGLSFNASLCKLSFFSVMLVAAYISISE